MDFLQLVLSLVCMAVYLSLSHSSPTPPYKDFTKLKNQKRSDSNSKPLSWSKSLKDHVSYEKYHNLNTHQQIVTSMNGFRGNPGSREDSFIDRFGGSSLFLEKQKLKLDYDNDDDKETSEIEFLEPNHFVSRSKSSHNRIADKGRYPEDYEYEDNFPNYSNEGREESEHSAPAGPVHYSSNEVNSIDSELEKEPINLMYQAHSSEEEYPCDEKNHKIERVQYNLDNHHVVTKKLEIRGPRKERPEFRLRKHGGTPLTDIDVEEEDKEKRTRKNKKSNNRSSRGDKKNDREPASASHNRRVRRTRSQRYNDPDNNSNKNKKNSRANKNKNLN